MRSEAVELGPYTAEACSCEPLVGNRNLAADTLVGNGLMAGAGPSFPLSLTRSLAAMVSPRGFMACACGLARFWKRFYHPAQACVRFFARPGRHGCASSCCVRSFSSAGRQESRKPAERTAGTLQAGACVRPAACAPVWRQLLLGAKPALPPSPFAASLTKDRAPPLPPPLPRATARRRFFPGHAASGGGFPEPCRWRCWR